MSKVVRLTPTFAEEKILRAQGYQYIAGIDEVGRGALAGPVVAAAVILPNRLKGSWLKSVKDSKMLTPQQREALFQPICEVAVAVGTGSADHKTIDRQGIVRATEIAMKLAVEQLSPQPGALLIDFMHLPEVTLPQKGVVDGDSLCFSIACASIVAKVTRDRLMVEMDKSYPGYLLGQHKGYGTPEHVACLCKLGPSPIHRLTFQPVKDVIPR
ncbi:MAG: ribonuclease HII [Chloroflexi bacterium]|nr:ribonuclease HII [Chloroflexota bacterium]